MTKIARSGRGLIPVTSRGYVVGENHHRAKLTDDDVRLILALLAEGVPHRTIAKKFEVGKSTITDISRGKHRCATPDGWRDARQAKRRERDRQLASRWPSRIKPAKPSEFD